MTADIAPNIAPDIILLTERIRRVWTLREHHVWEAANLLRPELKHETDNLDGRRFAKLVKSDALVEAVLILTSLVAPQRSITRISSNEMHWICSMRCDQTRPARSFKVCHADFAAALLISFLKSYADKLQRHELAPVREVREHSNKEKADEP